MADMKDWTEKRVAMDEVGDGTQTRVSLSDPPAVTRVSLSDTSPAHTECNIPIAHQ